MERNARHGMTRVRRTLSALDLRRRRRRAAADRRLERDYQQVMVAVHAPSRGVARPSR